MFFNTKGKHINVSKRAEYLLRYIETKQASDEFTMHLDDEVNKARQNKEWMVEYMKTLLHDMDVRDEGIAQGGTKKLIEQIIKKMNRQKSVEEIADELEETVENVQKIYDVVNQCGLESDVDTVYNKLLNE